MPRPACFIVAYNFRAAPEHALVFNIQQKSIGQYLGLSREKAYLYE